MSFSSHLLAQSADLANVTQESMSAFSEFIQPVREFFIIFSQWFHENRINLLAFVAGVIVTLVAASFVSWLIKRVFLRFSKKTQTVLDDKLLEGIHAPVKTFVIVTGVICSMVFIQMPLEVMDYLRRGYFAVATLIVVWGLLRVTSIVSDYLKEKADRTEGQLDNLLVDLLRKVAKIVIWLIAVLFIAQNIFRLNVSAMLAGAGVASLAIAFAAQNTIANVFGAISLIADKPFSIGDLIETNGKKGIVEALGLRSTTLRSLDGTVWSIPNKELAEASIQNISRRPNFKHVFEIGLVYSTSAARMARAVALLHEILDGNPMFDMEKLPPRIYFTELKDWSLNIQAIVWFQTTDYFLMLSEREKLNMKILERFNAEGLEFAFPSNTTYLAGDAARPLELKK